MNNELENRIIEDLVNMTMQQKSFCDLMDEFFQDNSAQMKDSLEKYMIESWQKDNSSGSEYGFLCKTAFIDFVKNYCNGRFFTIRTKEECFEETTKFNEMFGKYIYFPALTNALTKVNKKG